MILTGLNRSNAEDVREIETVPRFHLLRALRVLRRARVKLRSDTLVYDSNALGRELQIVEDILTRAFTHGEYQASLAGQDGYDRAVQSDSLPRLMLREAIYGHVMN